MNLETHQDPGASLGLGQFPEVKWMGWTISDSANEFTGDLPSTDMPFQPWHNSPGKGLLTPAQAGFPHIHPVLIQTPAVIPWKMHWRVVVSNTRGDYTSIYWASAVWCDVMCTVMMLFMGAAARLTKPTGNGQSMYQNRALTYNLLHPPVNPNPYLQ